MPRQSRRLLPPTIEAALNTCPVCDENLQTGVHDFDKHRNALFESVDESEWRKLAVPLDAEVEKQIEESMKRHPAGSKRHSG